MGGFRAPGRRGVLSAVSGTSDPRGMDRAPTTRPVRVPAGGEEPLMVLQGA